MALTPSTARHVVAALGPLVVALVLVGCAREASPGGGPSGAPLPTRPEAPTSWVIRVPVPNDDVASCWDDAAAGTVDETPGYTEITLADTASQDDANRIYRCVLAHPGHDDATIAAPVAPATP